MANYSIRDLEKLSGIKAHTIRIWEQRYNIIEPKRTPTNIRYYTDEDLQYVLNVAFLNRNGLRISKISKMSRQEITNKVASISQGNSENTNQLQTLTMAMIELNEEKFEQIVNTSIEKDGFEDTVINIIVPFLEKLSLLWLTGSISMVHEQFIHNLIRQKIAAQTDRLPAAKEESLKPKVVISEPQGEEQEVLLALINYMLRARGCKTLYLGKGISMNDLGIAVQTFEPTCIFTFVSDNNPKNSPQDYLNKLSATFENMQILASAHAVLRVPQLPANVILFEDFNEFVDFLEDLA